MRAVTLSVAGRKILLQLGGAAGVGKLVKKGIEISISVLVKRASIPGRLQTRGKLLPPFVNTWGLQLSALRETELMLIEC